MSRHDLMTIGPDMSHTFYAEQAYTVLVVEDEKAILDLTCIMLTRLGYNILAASSPEQSVLIAKEHPGEIDLLLTDIIMP